MPSVKSSSRPKVFDSSTVTTPSLPTRSMASARTSPIEGSAAEMDATWAISLLSSISLAWLLIDSTTAATALSMPRLRPIGLAPAATLRRPSRMSAWASTVAVVVPSPATSLVLVATSLTSWAPMFSKGSSSSTSRAMVTPSLVMVGAPNFLSITTLRPLGPSVTLTVSASALTPRSSDRRAFSSNWRIFAMRVFVLKVACRPVQPTPPRSTGREGWVVLGGVVEPLPAQRVSAMSLLDDREHVASRENEGFLAVVLDLGAAVLAVEPGVTDADVERQTLTVLETTRTHGQDDALLGLLLGSVRDHETRRGGLLGLKRLDHDAVLKRLDGNLGVGGRHDATSPFGDLTENVCRRFHRSVVAGAGPADRTGTLMGRVPAQTLGVG